jgi:hypothetical protein
MQTRRFRSWVRVRVAGGTLAALLIGLLAGCGGSPEKTPPTESVLTPLPSEAPAEATPIDYTQAPLKEITEEARAEYIESRFALPKGIADTERGPAPPLTPPGDQWDHRLRIPGTPLSPTVIHPEVYADPRLWTAVGPEYTPFTDDRGDWPVVVARRWYPMPIANTLFFGTLGGIIGHQSDHRDQGIFLGGTFGLMQDLMRW